ncbi:hypothetical protein CBR_g8154 [Chara braunii]|uniref:Uncharacterized protein n=1 Tax=Chara braunii TaxID=69332 RepID=A0A388KLC3_CHABU|nr:hypothetical protein CBR_g8154 [Chara braunii]|eukprot:GBG70854.1 hypothetical protein CBR_g8154 [Chara braunii]
MPTLSRRRLSGGFRTCGNVVQAEGRSRTLYRSVAQELRDNGTEEEKPSDDDDEEGESRDDDHEEEDTSKDADSEDTDFENDEGKNESGIDVDMFKKSLSGDLLGEGKQIIVQEVRRGLYSKSSKSETPPYNVGKRGRNVRVYIKKANYHVNMKNVGLVLKEDWCKANCYKKFMAVDVFYKREEFWAMKQPEQLNFFLAEMRVASYFSDEGDLEVLRVKFSGVKVCTKACGKLYGCSTTRVTQRIQRRNGVMLSYFLRKLAAHGAFDLSELQHVTRESYKVEQDHGVHVEEMTETMDWKLYVQDHLHNVNDISFNQHFQIKRNDDEEVRIWSKQYHNSQWQPNDREGLDIFKSEPTRQVQASPKHAIRSLEARYRLTCRGEDERRDKVVSSEGHVLNPKVGGSSKFKVDDDVLFIAALKANVHSLSHYAQPHNIEWWNKFIATQETLDLEDTNLKEPFAWPSVTADVSRAGEEVPPTANSFDQRWDDLFPPERPIYIGARKSRQFRKDRDGKYDDLEVNTFIALRACSGQEERGKPYHIGKVVEQLAANDAEKLHLQALLDGAINREQESEKERKETLLRREVALLETVPSLTEEQCGKQLQSILTAFVQVRNLEDHTTQIAEVFAKLQTLQDDLTDMTRKYHDLTKEVADLRQAQVANPLPLPPGSEAAIETTSAPLTVSSSTSSSSVMATPSGPAAGADSTVVVTSNEVGTSAIAATPRPESAAAGPSHTGRYVDRKAVQIPSKYDGKEDIES